MVDFLDIAPLTLSAEVRGHVVTVRGVEITDIAAIIFRFPELAVLVEKKKMDAAVFGALSKKVQAALIAAGVEQIDEAGAGNLTPGERALLIANILLLTVPSPAAPFLQALERIVGDVASAIKKASA